MIQVLLKKNNNNNCSSQNENIECNKVESKSYGPTPVMGTKIANDIKDICSEVIAFRNVENLDELFDLQQSIAGPITIEPVTKCDLEYLKIRRHDCEHVLAQAVQELYPDAKLSVGADTPNGFGYDFFVSKPFHPEDLERIEKRMHEIIDRDEQIVREVWSADDAIDFFKNKDEDIKAELIEMFEKRGITSLSIYRQGDWLDLCGGPHGSNTKAIGHAFKLNKLSGAQWIKNRGENNEEIVQLQRIGGVWWPTQEQLDKHLSNLEEAKNRDHRKLGMQMDLFHIEEHSPGMIFWHPRGWYIFDRLKQLIRPLLLEQGYQEVNTPGVLSAELWKKSGHWDTFRENMFCVHDEDKEYAIKPMSCPAHIEIFKSHFMGGVKSYNDLPLRIAEFGEVYRNEATGALQGLKRVRRLTQDDGHIFCTPDHIGDEIIRYCQLFKKVYDLFGFNYSVDLSTRPENRLGEETVWDRAEDALGAGAKLAGLQYKIAEGEGAFYGPKLDFHITDSLDRQWQCCTVQLDFILAERLGATYIDTEGQKQHPVMIHRAVFGSLERFIAILLEHFNGYLPLWLAPVKCVFIPMHESVHGVCKDMMREIQHDLQGLILDDRNESLGYKIREWTQQRAVKLVVFGKKELEAGTVTIRDVATGESKTMSRDDFVKEMRYEVQIPESARSLGSSNDKI